jgi:integrase
MAHVRKVSRKKAGGKAAHAWQVRYRDPDRVEKSRTFRTRDEADRFARKVEVSKDEGSYIDPALGKTLFRDWSEEWLASSAPGLKPRTVSGYRSLLKNHILPAFGTTPLAKIRPVDVRRWVANLSNEGMSSSRVRSSYFLLQAVLRAAVESAYIGRSPCLGVKLPRAVVREMLFLSAEEVRSIAAAVPDQYRSLIYLLAYGGIRWGEAAALRRKRVNVLRQRVEVAESLSDVDGTLYFGPTKTHQARQVALPKSLNDQLRAHLESYVPKGRDALVFTSPEGDPLRLPNFRRRVWWPALDVAGISRAVRIHDLRHTCASLLIAQGAHPKAIQQHLGHSSISVTMDRYGHLFPDDQERLAAALDEIIR